MASSFASTSSGPIAIPLASSTSASAAPTTSPIQSPRSLRSVSTTHSTPPEIASNTLNLLAQFHNERTKQEAKFARLEAKAKAQLAKAQQQQQKAEEDAAAAAAADDDDGEGALAEAEAWADIERLARVEAGLEPVVDVDVGALSLDDDDSGATSDVLSVDEWHQVVKEDYQQSQFWYSTPFAYSLARHIHSRLESISAASSDNHPPPSIAFLCSPTAFVAFQHLYHSSGKYRSGENLFLMEIDQRFSIAAGQGYVRYDYNFPTKGLAALKNKIDMVVIDPPFLNKPTTDCIAQTVEHLLVPPGASAVRPRGGDILLITGDSISAYAAKTYPLPGQPDLVRTPLQIEHEGGRLSNEFGCWASWEGGEEFGLSEE